MKIAIACNNLAFITGGPRLIFGLAEFLQKLGHQVVIYGPESGGDFYKDITKNLDMRVVTPKMTPPSGEKTKGFIDWVARKIHKERYNIALAQALANAMDADFDVVNVHDFAYRVGYFYKRRNPKTKVVWHENAPPFAYVKRNNFLRDASGLVYGIIENFLTKKYFRAMDAVVVLDEFNKQWSTDAEFKNVTIVRPGIDFDKFFAPVKDFTAKAARKEMHLLAVGALNAYRRFDNIIEAVRILHEGGYNATVEIVANNIWHEDACRDALVALVKKYRLENYIQFYFEGMPETDIIKKFQTCDVFVQAVYSPPPSHHGWGLVNFEALAAGVPLVVVRSATATEVLKENENALFFEPLNMNELAHKIKLLADHPDKYKKLAEAGQKYVRENQSWKKYAEEMAAVFKNALVHN